MMHKNELTPTEIRDKFIVKRKENEKKTMKFFTKHTIHIEVNREDGEIEKTYFYIPPVNFSHYL